MSLLEASSIQMSEDKSHFVGAISLNRGKVERGMVNPPSRRFMAGTYFKLNASDFTKALTKGAERIGDTKELMEAIGEALVSGAKDRFSEEKAPDGTAWVKGRKKSGKTLVDRGTLKKSITCNAGISEVVYGSNLEYAAIHQFGGEIEAKNKKALSFIGADGKRVCVKKVTIPARPFIDVSEEDDAEIKEMITQHMQDAFK